MVSFARIPKRLINNDGGFKTVGSEASVLEGGDAGGELSVWRLGLFAGCRISDFPRSRLGVMRWLESGTPRTDPPGLSLAARCVRPSAFPRGVFFIVRVCC